MDDTLSSALHNTMEQTATSGRTIIGALSAEIETLLAKHARAGVRPRAVGLDLPADGSLRTPAWFAGDEECLAVELVDVIGATSPRLHAAARYAIASFPLTVVTILDGNVSMWGFEDVADLRDKQRGTWILTGVAGIATQVSADVARSVN